MPGRSSSDLLSARRICAERTCCVGPKGDIGPQGPIGPPGPGAACGDVYSGVSAYCTITSATGTTGTYGYAIGGDLFISNGGSSWTTAGVTGPFYFFDQNSVTWVGGTTDEGCTGTVLSCEDASLLIDSDSGDLYCCEGDTWAYCCNMQGPTGAAGPTGPRGLQGIQGIQGIQGPTGPTGPAMTAPLSIYNTGDNRITIGAGLDLSANSFTTTRTGNVFLSGTVTIDASGTTGNVYMNLAIDSAIFGPTGTHFLANTNSASLLTITGMTGTLPAGGSYTPSLYISGPAGASLQSYSLSAIYDL